jgi:hypothetical protein
MKYETATPQKYENREVKKEGKGAKSEQENRKQEN